MGYFSLWWGGIALAISVSAQEVDFNRDIRPMLSGRCFTCHGPDASERKGGTDGLRLDTQEGALADLGGHAAVVPGDPDASQLLARVLTKDVDDVMPPVDSGDPLDAQEISLLRRWIEQGAPYASHWSYAAPVRVPLPEVQQPAWIRHPLDAFILSRLEQEGFLPSEEADRSALARRAALDLTGLPPSVAEVKAFLEDPREDAFERYVDRLLADPVFGEHWARMWLDLARYADSAGYADDPPRTIWAYRDYVIRAFNGNKPFDQFTTEQLAGDLLKSPSEDQLIATAFHRNTRTNNEGGTDDEEFRNVAIVDRVNTTMAVWMGTTVECAQCHNHKYDPISQEDYYRLFAVFNQSEDADRRDESPLLPLYHPSQRREMKDLDRRIQSLEKELATPTPALEAAQLVWEQRLQGTWAWDAVKPSMARSESGVSLALNEDLIVRQGSEAKVDRYTLEIPLAEDRSWTGLQIEVRPPVKPQGDAGRFVLTGVSAWLRPPEATPVRGRYIRVELPGKDRILSLAEVQAWSGGFNIAEGKEASQSSTAYEGHARYAVDGHTEGDFEAKSTTHTETSVDPWWEVDLGGVIPLSRVTLWNRTDGNVGSRLDGCRLVLLDEARQVVWEQLLEKAPSPRKEVSVDGLREIQFGKALADTVTPGYQVSSVLEESENKGWSAPLTLEEGRGPVLSLLLNDPVEIPSGATLLIRLDQQSDEISGATLGAFRVSMTSHPGASASVTLPALQWGVLQTPDAERTEAQRSALAGYYRSQAPLLSGVREELTRAKASREAVQPYTTVPVMRERSVDSRRVTRIQRRGNFQDLGDEVTSGLPPALNGGGEGDVNRLSLAQWLMDAQNPLTARVLANRLWSAVFGVGIVRTQEEFGSQGEAPVHPELLDWLALRLVDLEWDFKAFLRELVTSATYRQSSRVTSELLAVDPDNRLLTRGPRFRLSAEMIRDQALYVSGLLNLKQFGPPVRPLQPQSGLSAAFGSRIDWKTSEDGEQHRRALYTQWRRSNPYPSMATFDAPNREVCVLTRDRSNTPLQALVTLNDPVYLEAARALARRMMEVNGGVEEGISHGFERCLARAPSSEEQAALLALYQKAHERFEGIPDAAETFLTMKAEAAVPWAAWTVVANALLNLDEFLMKR